MTVTKERAMQMFDHDLDIMMDDLRGMQAHYQIADWEAFVFLRKPGCPQSYVVKYAAADDGFAKQIVELHQPSRASVAAPPNPWAKLIGRYKDDPTWQEFGAFLESYRAEADRIYAESVAATVDAEPPVRCVHCGATEHSYQQDWDHPFESLAVAAPSLGSSIQAAAAEICGYFGDTELAMGGHVNANGVAAILSKWLGSAAVGEQDSLPMVVVRKAAQEPCRSYAKGCAVNQPKESFWCAPCTARHALAATPTSTQT